MPPLKPSETGCNASSCLNSVLLAKPFAVNVSILEFQDRDFVSRVERPISGYGIEYGNDPMSLQIEMTETAVRDDIEHAVKVLRQLKAMGATILLHDFDTGQSSLTYVARFPLNKTKIDKSFISQLDNDLASRSVTDAILTLGVRLVWKSLQRECS